MDLRDKLRDTRTKWKATLTSYDLVFALNTAKKCYSLDDQEIALILSLLDTAQWKTRWYSPSGMSISELLIHQLIGRLTNDLSNESNDCSGSGGNSVGCSHYISEVFWMLSSTAPTGCLNITYGGTWNRSAYPDLWAALPAGMKTDTTFTFPDMTGRGLVGQDFLYQSTYPNFTQIYAGQTAGELTVVLSQVEMPAHEHSRTPGGEDIYDHNVVSGTGSFTHSPGTGKYDVGSKTGSTGGNMPHNNLPPALAGYWFVQAEACTSNSSSLLIRMSECTLQYSEDAGATWVNVENWGSLDECFGDLLPFDLRFNNCNLEYSKDGAQTWATVPGWSELTETCLSGQSLDNLQFKFEDGILWYSKDDGGTWNSVLGWNNVYDSVDERITQADRCQTAYGVARKLALVTLELWRGAILLNGNYEEYVQEVYTSWHGLGLPEPIPDYLDSVINWLYTKEGDDGQILVDLADELTVQSRAEYVFSASMNGRWCDENIERYERLIGCFPLAANYHMLMWHTFKAIHAAYAYQEKVEDFRAFLWQMRDYGQCGECDLEEITLCQQSGPYDTCWTFADGVGNWEVVTSPTCWNMTSNGIDTTGLYGDCQEDVRTGIEIEIALSGSETWASVSGKSMGMCGACGVSISLLAQVAGNWIAIDSANTGVWNYVITASGTIPAGATRLRAWLYSAGQADIAVTAARIQGDGFNTVGGGECS